MVKGVLAESRKHHRAWSTLFGSPAPRSCSLILIKNDVCPPASDEMYGDPRPGLSARSTGALRECNVWYACWDCSVGILFSSSESMSDADAASLCCGDQGFQALHLAILLV
jgi:hypothetical protein